MWKEIFSNEEKEMDKFVNIVNGFSCTADISTFTKEMLKGALIKKADCHAFIYDDGTFQCATMYKYNNRYKLIQVIKCVIKWNIFDDTIDVKEFIPILGRHLKKYMLERNSMHMFMFPYREEQIKQDHILKWFGKPLEELLPKGGIKTTRDGNYWEYEII